MTLPPAIRKEYVAPTWAPIYPRDSIHGTNARTEPVAWLDADGHRYTTRQRQSGQKASR